ncbi:MAG TPA: hypothetical protein VGR40_03640, partial [Candidatus Binatus sp.]|nr:hypothetical protein [Candidatus Binatus sp.]
MRTAKDRKSAHKKAQQLLSGLSLSKSEIQARLEQATNPSYWRTLYPSFSVGDAPPTPDLPPLDAATLDRYARG